MTVDLLSVMAADVTALFQLGGLTVPVVFTPATAPSTPVPLQGIFDEDFVEVDPHSRMPIASLGPAVHLQTGAIPAEPDDADRLVIKGRTFSVQEPRPNGEGVTLYILHEVRA